MNTTLSSFDAYAEQYQKSIANPEDFWSNVAADFKWRKKWDKVLEWDFHKAEVKWFIGGKLNITENCIDRHLPQFSFFAFLFHDLDNSQRISHTVFARGRRIETQTCVV